MFKERSGLALSSKIATVSSGIVPQAIDFHSLCDLRPVFNESRDKAIEYVPIALVRVLVRNEGGNDSPLAFQIDKSGVLKLEAFLERLKKKMDYLDGVRSKLLGGGN